MAVKRSSTHAMQKRHATQDEIARQKALEMEKKWYKYGGIALAVIVVLIVLIKLDIVPHLNGSMHYIGGKLIGYSETDINACADSSAHRYYDLGTFTMPEGYECDPTETLKTTDSNLNDWFLRKEADDINLTYIYISGTAMPWEERIKSVVASYTTTDEAGNVTEPAQYSGTTESGNKYHVAISPAEVDSYSSVPKYNKYATCFVEAKHDCSVLIMVTSSSGDPEGFPADEVYMKYVKEGLACIELN